MGDVVCGLFGALEEGGHPELAALLRDNGLTASVLARKEVRSKHFALHDVSLEGRAAVLEYLTTVTPKRNAWGMPSLEGSETLKAAREFKMFSDLAKLSPEEALSKRREHFYHRYATIDHVPLWSQYSVPEVANPHLIVSTDRWGSEKRQSLEPSDLTEKFPYSASLNDKVSLWRGSIVDLEIDAVVNAANNGLRGGGGIDGAIHGQAGPLLDEECAGLGGCATGESKTTRGYRMPAKHVIHTVGPTTENPAALASCYQTVLAEAKKNKLRTVAFCCVSTGIYGFPLVHAAKIALATAREWLETDDNASLVDRLVFCVFLEIELQVYERLMPAYFPQRSATEAEASGEAQPEAPETPEAAAEAPEGAAQREEHSDPKKDAVEASSADAPEPEKPTDAALDEPRGDAPGPEQ